MKSLDERLAEIQKRADAATEGPWGFDYDRESNGEQSIGWLTPVSDYYGCGSHLGEWKTNDLNFIINSRTDLPKLLKALKLAVGALEQFANKEWETVTPETAQSALTEINQIFETGEKS